MRDILQVRWKLGLHVIRVIGDETNVLVTINGGRG